MKLTIGEKIALLRKEKNVTQTELKNKIGRLPITAGRRSLILCGLCRLINLPLIMESVSIWENRIARMRFCAGYKKCYSFC